MFDHMTRENRHILSFAMEEAADLGHAQLGTDHLILGMLCNARSDVYALLTEQGFTLAAARETVREIHGDDDGAATATAEADAEQVDEDREALKSVGIDLDKVADAIKRAFGTDITDGWSQRGPERRGRGGPHRHDHRGHDHRGHDHGGRGRRGHGRGPWDGPDCGPGGRRGPGGPGAWGDDEAWEAGPWQHGRGRRGPRGRGGPWGRPRFSASARAALGEAVRICRESATDDERGGRLRAEHVLLGILAVGDEQSRRLIESVTTVDRLREALTAAV
ncbi:Clp protease N-terminal domain-containing protein [Williamsia serinedens]|uniref:Clp amino terminal domain-containing protein, pathogenicity island component n=1 Tax=Williamsia serinedens TaxID=391736 RepID=A0ABT1H3Q3_9NOCA|nr:Clp protease N-terminal domain-containing protein [Williamsia serinedens]MCP2161864.1 Clp amino terminal domain-containing protein, pathogenicity island component [Williamsia serinedens]